MRAAPQIFSRTTYAWGRLAAFTLVELLAVLLVLSLLSLLLLRLTGDTQRLVSPNMRRMNADGQAQLAFDRLFMDIAGMLGRADAPSLIANSPDGSALLKLFAFVPSETGNRGISLVSYRMAKDTQSGAPLTSGAISLQRASKGIDWDQIVMGTKNDSTEATFADLPDALAFADSDYDVLAPGIIRMTVTCQMLDTGGVQASVPVTDSGNADLSKIAGIVVTAVALDAESLGLLRPEQVEAMAAAFPAPVDGVLPAEAWQARAANPDNFSGIPSVSARSLRVYQRVFPVKAGGN